MDCGEGGAAGGDEGLGVRWEAVGRVGMVGIFDAGRRGCGEGSG